MSSTANAKRQRQKARRAERLAEQQAEAKRQAIRGRVFAIVLIVVVGAFLAWLVTGVLDSIDVTLGVEPATIDGSALATQPDAGPDPAVGQVAPSTSGFDPSGQPVTIGEGAGGPQAVVFMAHWCPHCDEELPMIAQWVDDGLLPEDVRLVAVSTRHDPARPNWPPDEWLSAGNFPGEVVVDPDESVAEAWGLVGTPMWVFLDADGVVVDRAAGQIGADRFAEGVTAATG